ncbi:MAG: hypothetical protein OXC62_08425 [Aestuariivita sp.]|nr:hypothetical protein [Aestuariivita sp.]
MRACSTSPPKPRARIIVMVALVFIKPCRTDCSVHRLKIDAGGHIHTDQFGSCGLKFVRCYVIKKIRRYALKTISLPRNRHACLAHGFKTPDMRLNKLLTRSRRVDQMRCCAVNAAMLAGDVIDRHVKRTRIVGGGMGGDDHALFKFGQLLARPNIHIGHLTIGRVDHHVSLVAHVIGNAVRKIPIRLSTPINYPDKQRSKAAA